MSEKFTGQYGSNQAGRVSYRLQNWDYSSNAAYFITICTHNREHFFGEIHNNKMELSRQGVIADLLWHEIKHHTKNVELGDFIVMPNHVHGILILNDGEDGRCMGVTRRDVARNVPTGNAPTGNASSDNVTGPATDTTTPNVPAAIPPTIGGTDVVHNAPANIPPAKNEQMAAISPKANTVPVIIRSYKSAVTKHCNRLGFTFAWQTRFHDHIIRNEASFQQISTYIRNNPTNWEEDKFH